MKTNVIIGRFQVDKLTRGHKWLVDSAMKKRKDSRLVFLIGISPVSYTDKNPLTGGLRYRMLEAAYPGCTTEFIHDNPSDTEWSEQVDKILSKYKNPVLFGSRDCFVHHYHGKHKFVEIKEIPTLSATNRRKELREKYIHNQSFRAGVIHAVENRFPTAYPTVDIAVLRLSIPFVSLEDLVDTNWKYQGIIEILLGRKPGRTKFCFPGGFVDPTDESLEQAAGRELSEEVPGIITHEFKYIGSTKVDDFRYRGTKDGIMTSLFVTYILGGSTVAGDDLEETKFFDIATFDMNKLSEHHHPLFEMLKKHLKL